MVFKRAADHVSSDPWLRRALYALVLSLASSCAAQTDSEPPDSQAGSGTGGAEPHGGGSDSSASAGDSRFSAGGTTSSGGAADGGGNSTPEPGNGGNTGDPNANRCDEDRTPEPLPCEPGMNPAMLLDDLNDLDLRPPVQGYDEFWQKSAGYEPEASTCHAALGSAGSLRLANPTYQGNQTNIAMVFRNGGKEAGFDASGFTGIRFSYRGEVGSYADRVRLGIQTNADPDADNFHESGFYWASDWLTLSTDWQHASVRFDELTRREGPNDPPVSMDSSAASELFTVQFDVKVQETGSLGLDLGVNPFEIYLDEIYFTSSQACP